jgi:hypothetical protein
MKQSSLKQIIILLLFVSVGFLQNALAAGMQKPSADTLLASSGSKNLYLYHNNLLLKDALKGATLSLPDPGTANPYFFALGGSGKWLLVSSRDGKAKLYRIDQDVTLYDSFPFKVEAAAFSDNGEDIYLVHSKKFLKASLALYSANDRRIKAERKVRGKTNSLTLNGNDSVLLIAAGPLVSELDAKSLKTRKVHWEKTHIGLMSADPANPNRYVAVTSAQDIIVNELQGDKTVIRINSGKGKIKQIAIDSSGKHIMALYASQKLAVWNLDDNSSLLLDHTNALTGFGSAQMRARAPSGWIDATVPASGMKQSKNAKAFGTNDLTVLPTPVIIYTPENGLALGVGATMLFNKKTGPGQQQLPTTITPAVTYSLKKSFTASLGIDHYFGRNWHFTNQTILQQKGRSYYLGLGDQVSDTAKTLYKNDVFSTEGEFTGRIAGHLQGGVRYHFRHDSPLEFDKGAQPQPPAQSGWLTGIGPLLRFDSRDDALYPTTGQLILVSAVHYGSYLGGDYSYNDVRADYRLYHKLGPGVLAWRAYFQGTFNGNAPFYQLPYISADHVLRGLLRNQYIDKQSLSAETEFRGDFSRVDKRFGYLLFAGAGDVSENFFRNYHPKVTGVFGAGFRQQLIPKSNLQSHLEVSFTTRGDVGVFGGIGLAF